MKYANPFPGAPLRRHNPLDPPSVLWLVPLVGIIALIGLVLMIAGVSAY